MKVMTVVGTRPEIIRLACVLPLLDETVDHTLVHTGQNYDYELNEVFFQDLGLRAPDRFLSARVSSPGALMGDVLVQTEALIDELRPDAFLVLGDTNSCVAALIARRKGITVFHMEAGNRCWDLNVPEETNRRMVDHVSDINLCYTEHARRNLLAEGKHPRTLYVTGSPMYEVLTKFGQRIAQSSAVESHGLVGDQYLLVSLHREENVDKPARFLELIESISGAARALAMPCLVSVHPRTAKRLDALPAAVLEPLTLSKPLGFHDYNRLQKDAYAVISDSGTISEESSMLGFAGVTPRISIERPEALDSGTITLAGSTTTDMLAAIAHSRRVVSAGLAIPPAEYRVLDFSHRVLNAVLSLTPVRAQWDGVRR
jgi:UDP-N-acetyl-L-fucosamine synthase